MTPWPEHFHTSNKSYHLPLAPGCNPSARRLPARPNDFDNGRTLRQKPGRVKLLVLDQLPAWS